MSTPIPPGMKPRPPMGGDSPIFHYYDFHDQWGNYIGTRMVEKPKPPKSDAELLADQIVAKWNKRGSAFDQLMAEHEARGKRVRK